MRNLARLMGCLLIVFHQGASADTSERWFSWHSLQGEFLQRHLDASQSLVSVSSGKFAVKRPSFAKALFQVDGDLLIGNALQIERDPQPIGRA